jgi:hypothetical protein
VPDPTTRETTRGYVPRPQLVDTSIVTTRECSKCGEPYVARRAYKKRPSGNGIGTRGWTAHPTCEQRYQSRYRKERLQELRAYAWGRRHLNRFRKYGLTRDDFMEMMASQWGRCAICCAELDWYAHIDHCHHSGRVRGLLCGTCNAGIGSLHDDPALLRQAIGYLERGECDS